MTDNNPSTLPQLQKLAHLKRVSRIKHVILEKYIPPWAQILGSRHSHLAYVDCFAGPGRYEFEGKEVQGSPIIAVREAVRFVETRGGSFLDIYLVDDKPKQVDALRNVLRELEPYPKNLAVNVVCADSHTFIPNLLQHLSSEVPSFFFVDPYWHPLPIPVIRRILNRNRAEILINLMWYQINRDLANPQERSRLNQFFGDEEWRYQPFIEMTGASREKAFLEYFKTRLGCADVREFKIRFDQEDTRGGDATKYYLLHGSNHVKAALLMKEVMWHLGDEQGTFEYSGEPQLNLISETPPEDELRALLLNRLAHRELRFDEIRELTWDAPFIEKNYRSVLKGLEGAGVTIKRRGSKKTGLGGTDVIRFD